MVVYVVFLCDVACQKLLNSANVSRSYSQNNTGTVFFETRCIYLLVTNFLQCICAKNFGNWLAVDKVIAKIIWLTFFWPTLYISIYVLGFPPPWSPFEFHRQ